MLFAMAMPSGRFKFQPEVGAVTVHEVMTPEAMVHCVTEFPPSSVMYAICLHKRRGQKKR